MSYFFPSFIAIFGWGEGAFNAFLIAGCLRLVAAQHLADAVLQIPAFVDFLSKNGTWSATDAGVDMGAGMESENMLRSGSMLDVHDLQARPCFSRNLALAQFFFAFRKAQIMMLKFGKACIKADYRYTCPKRPLESAGRDLQD